METYKSSFCSFRPCASTRHKCYLSFPCIEIQLKEAANYFGPIFHGLHGNERTEQNPLIKTGASPFYSNGSQFILYIPKKKIYFCWENK